uniref:Uncharacterized protein n=1 Tax=Rhizophora mucronata TaxID=61149 RepID=A0A2P2PV37_RHIMU
MCILHLGVSLISVPLVAPLPPTTPHHVCCYLWWVHIFKP